MIPRFLPCIFVWIGAGLGVLYWLLESSLHAFIFRQGHFAAQILNPDPHEIWKRMLVTSLLILFGVFAQFSINARKRAARALEESERKYRTVFEKALNPIFVFDEAGRYIDHNKAALSFLECTRDELLSKRLGDYSPSINAERNQGGDSLVHHRRVLESDYLVGGRIKTLLYNMIPLYSSGQPLVYCIGLDISERKRMERAIEITNRELNQIFQTASVGMRVVDRDFNILRINETFARLAGVNQTEAVGKKCYEVFRGNMCEKPNCPLRQILRGEERVEYYVTKERPDGKSIPCILTANRFVGPLGEFVGMVESFRDITELKLAQEVIKLERDKLNRILSNLAEGVSIVNVHFTIEYENKIHNEYFSAGKGKKCYLAYREAPSPCGDCFMHEALNTGEKQHCEFVSSSGRSFEQVYTPFTDFDGEEKVIVLLRDITEKKAALAAVMRTERLAALGELAAGVAHEINNPLNGIINYAQLLVNKNDERSVTHNISKRITKEGDRIAKIVEGLLSFARREKEGKTPVTVSEILSDSLALTMSQMRKDAITVRADLPVDLPPILAKAQEIEQVFLNILSNARYALIQKYPEVDDKKVIEIIAKTLKVDGRQFLRISFRDQGTGIPSEIIDKVMNPFFTTKPEGKRTGLGLSISHGIVNDHGGSLTIESVEGEFTRVDVDLPLWTETAG